jgi:hypothetical protein
MYPPIHETAGEVATKEELLALVARMRKVAEQTYALFFVSGMGAEVHAFIEFNGVISKYVDICQRCALQGIDFRFLNTHGSQALPVHAHDMAYLGEKLDCIFGPAIRGNTEARDTLRSALFGPSASLAAAKDALTHARAVIGTHLAEWPDLRREEQDRIDAALRALADEGTP